MARGHTPISPIELTSPQDLTTSWTDIGDQYSCFGFNVIGIYLKLTINDSQDFRIRILAKTSAESSDEYILPINLVTSEKNYVTDQLAEIDVDEDKNMLLFFDIDTVVPYFKIQVQGGFIGSIPATIDKIAYCLGEK
jgi:hypothetical protein